MANKKTTVTKTTTTGGGSGNKGLLTTGYGNVAKLFLQGFASNLLGAEGGKTVTKKTKKTTYT